MAREWRSTTWGEEISLEYGRALRGYDEARGKYRVYGSNGPIGWTHHSLASGPGVILGRKGAYRGVEFSKAPFFVIDTAYYVVPKSELDMRWLYYAIRYHGLGEIDDGSPIPSTTRAAVYVRPLRVPPIAEQKAIAKVLGALDDKIELNRQMNATLEAMAQALFQSWFVDFDPIRAKRDGRAPACIDPAVAAHFPDTFQESSLGAIPRDWEVGRLDDVLVLQRGFDLPAPDRTHGTYPVIAAGGLNGYHDRFMVRGPGVTTGRSGVLGKVFFIPGDFWPLNTSLWVKEFKRVSPAYAYHLLRHLNFETFNAGSAVPTLNRNHVHNLPVLVPPKALVNTFDALVLPLLRKQKFNQEQSQSLASVRDALLPKLLSGELAVNSKDN